MSNETDIVAINPGFMQVNSLDAAMACAELISKSSFCPKGMNGKPGDIVVALQMGQELGLKPMQALQNIAVINGRPSLWGDAMLAVCRQSSQWEYIKEEYLEDKKVCICSVKRKNEPVFIQSFSEADAKTAGLWSKEGPWRQYPKRMLQMRARGFALRDAFPDLLRGIITPEEAEDMPRVDYSKSVGDIFEGEIVENQKISESDVAHLRGLIIESGALEVDICHHLEIEKLEDMILDKLDGVTRLLNKKVNKKKKDEKLEINRVLGDDNAPMTDSAKEFFGEE